MLFPSVSSRSDVDFGRVLPRPPLLPHDRSHPGRLRFPRSLLLQSYGPRDLPPDERTQGRVRVRERRFWTLYASAYV